MTNNWKNDKINFMLFFLRGDKMNFEFCTASNIVFGSGSLAKLGSLAKVYADNYLIVYGKNSITETGVLGRIEKQLSQEGLSFCHYNGIYKMPNLKNIEMGVSLALSNGCNGVIAVGGGSVIDTGKAISGFLTNKDILVDYSNKKCKKYNLTKEAAPFIAIPTTAGVGCEVTQNIILDCHDVHNKQKLRDKDLLPKVALVDPLLTLTMPKEQIAIGGMAALTHLVESYISKKSNSMVEVLAIKGIKLVGESLEDAYNDCANLKSRENMSLASLLGGICMNNADTGLTHNMATIIGSYFNIPYGLSCGIILPYVIKNNKYNHTKKLYNMGEALVGKNIDSEIEGAKIAVKYIEKIAYNIGIPKDFRSHIKKDSNLENIAKMLKDNSEAWNKSLDGYKMANILGGLL
jgi:alcohol dehydrogenase class IV